MGLSCSLIQHVFSNDVERLDIGQAQYGYMPNAKGGIVDDLLVYRIDQQRYFLLLMQQILKKIELVGDP